MKFQLMVCLFLSLPALAGNQAFNYEPSSVELNGVLELQTFPGPPNYDSIASGDQIERDLYLKLDQPIDVIEGKQDHIDNPATERNVTVVQLAINAEDGKLWSKFRSAGKDAHVRVKGGLFHRFTGHHHARVLLDVQSMEALTERNSGRKE
ncbi:MAG: DUF4431 domain-containing protein [Oligoflexia bacterium]|nr:DUF4431 domain-containing protein [Oligoflexia bacterium]